MYVPVEEKISLKQDKPGTGPKPKNVKKVKK
jgi:hypothetical protein